VHGLKKKQHTRIIQNGSFCQQTKMYVLCYFAIKSVFHVQRRYGQKTGEQALGRHTIKRRLEQFQEAGSVLNNKGA
jgi:hypothetical protein